MSIIATAARAATTDSWRVHERPQQRAISWISGFDASVRGPLVDAVFGTGPNCGCGRARDVAVIPTVADFDLTCGEPTCRGGALAEWKPRWTPLHVSHVSDADLRRARSAKLIDPLPGYQDPTPACQPNAAWPAGCEHDRAHRTGRLCAPQVVLAAVRSTARTGEPVVLVVDKPAPVDPTALWKPTGYRISGSAVVVRPLAAAIEAFAEAVDGLALTGPDRLRAQAVLVPMFVAVVVDWRRPLANPVVRRLAPTFLLRQLDRLAA